MKFDIDLPLCVVLTIFHYTLLSVHTNMHMILCFVLLWLCNCFFDEFVRYFYLYSSALNHWHWTKDQKSVSEVIPKKICKIDCFCSTAKQKNCKFIMMLGVCCLRFKVYEVNVTSVINLLWSSDVIWRCRCWSTLARNTKLLFELMLNYHQRCSVIFNWV